MSGIIGVSGAFGFTDVILCMCAVFVFCTAVPLVVSISNCNKTLTGSMFLIVFSCLMNRSSATICWVFTPNLLV